MTIICFGTYNSPDKRCSISFFKSLNIWYNMKMIRM